MPRFIEHRGRLRLAATLALFLVAVSVAPIDDYGMLSEPSPRSSGDVVLSSDATVHIRATATGSRPASEHDCSCLLCTATVSDSLRSRVYRPPAGSLPATVVAAIAGSLHSLEVFHPPSS